MAENRFTINLLSPLPSLPLAPLTINNFQAQGMTVKGNNTFRIFTLVDSAVVTINNLTISDGFSTINNLIISNGFSTDGFSTDDLGGGIFMGDSSTLNLNGSSVINNSASGNGGGIYMSSSSTLTINNSTLSGNTGLNGGGIYIDDSGTLNMNANTINANTAIDGGGIFNNTSGTLNAASNTIDGNTATGNGGGIYNNATINLTNNTVSSNTAAKGGGIYNNFTATLINNLVALNTAADGNDLVGRGSLGNAYTGTYNLIGNADGSEGIVTDTTNQAGSTLIPIAPMLGILQNNGGITLTRALLFGSPAIDKGNSSTLITDQRGQTRPYDNPIISNTGNGADIGAFEVQLAPTPASVSISGWVITPQKFGLNNALITLTDSQGISQTIFKLAHSGGFRFNGVMAGKTYILRVSSKRYTYAPQVINVTEDIEELYFTVQ